MNEQQIEIDEILEFECEQCGHTVRHTRQSNDMYEDTICENCESIITIYYNDDEI